MEEALKTRRDGIHHGMQSVSYRQPQSHPPEEFRGNQLAYPVSGTITHSLANLDQQPKREKDVDKPASRADDGAVREKGTVRNSYAVGFDQVPEWPQLGHYSSYFGIIPIWMDQCAQSRPSSHIEDFVPLHQPTYGEEASDGQAGRIVNLLRRHQPTSLYFAFPAS